MSHLLSHSCSPFQTLLVYSARGAITADLVTEIKQLAGLFWVCPRTKPCLLTPRAAA